MVDKQVNVLFRWKARRHLRQLRRQVGLAYASVAVWTRDLTPDFLGIGAPRSATTWLHVRLSLHPSLYLPRTKEIHFFDEPRNGSSAEYKYGPDVQGYGLDHFDMNSPAHWRWYALQFAKCNGRIKGEITPSYSMLSNERISVIAERLPYLKIIYILRNPIDRTWSSLRKTLWWHTAKRPCDLESNEVLLEMAMRPGVVARGDYRRVIENWERHFSGRILYLFYDDVASHPRQELARVCQFLEVDPSLLPDQEGDSTRVNKAPADDMPRELREALEAHYAPQIAFLEEKFGRDLSHWRSWS